MMTENKKKLSGYKLKVALWDFKVPLLNFKVHLRIESASTSFNGSSCVWKWPRPSVLSINDAEPLATTKNRQTNSIKVHFDEALWNQKRTFSI